MKKRNLNNVKLVNKQTNRNTVNAVTGGKHKKKPASVPENG